MSADRVIGVVAGILADQRGKVLLARRPPGSHMAGSWEFPGGKIEGGETPKMALARELREELGVDVQAAEPFRVLRHRYADKTVELHFWRVSAYLGHPRGMERQELAWAPIAELGGWDILAADWPVVNALRLPSSYMVTPEPWADAETFLAGLRAAVANGIRLIQFRAPSLDSDAYRKLLPAVVGVCRSEDAGLIVHGHPEWVIETGSAGVHFSARQLMSLAERPLSRQYWVGASCHTVAEIDHATSLGFDYLSVGSVQATRTHPTMTTPLGWEAFARLVGRTSLPVYAIGGLSARDIDAVRDAGGHGVSGIRGFWPQP